MDVAALSVAPQEVSTNKGNGKALRESDQDKSAFSKHLDDNVERLKNDAKPAVKEKSASEKADKASPVKADEVASEEPLETPTVQSLKEPSTQGSAGFEPTIALGSGVLEAESTPLVPVPQAVEQVDPNKAELLISSSLVENSAGRVDKASLLAAGKDLPVMLANEGLAAKSKPISFNPLLAEQGQIKQALVDPLTSKAVTPLATDFVIGQSINQVLPKVNVALKAPQVASLLGNEAIKTAPASLPEVTANLLTTGAQVPTEQQVSAKSIMTIDTPVNNPRWGTELGKNIQWMMNQSMSGAQIKLNPQHLGPIEVRLQIDNGQASVAFTAQHGAAREAIEAAMPRLREMMAEQNIDLLDANVSEHSFSEQQQQGAQDGAEQLNAEQEMDKLATSSLFDDQNELRRSHDGVFSQFA